MVPQGKGVWTYIIILRPYPARSHTASKLAFTGSLLPSLASPLKQPILYLKYNLNPSNY